MTSGNWDEPGNVKTGPKPGLKPGLRTLLCRPHGTACGHAAAAAAAWAGSLAHCTGWLAELGWLYGFVP